MCSAIRQKQRLHDKHISLNITEDVNSICAPLFSKTDINYFHYGRVYPDGYSLVLISHPGFHKYFWEKEYDKIVFPNYKEGLFINKPDTNHIIEEANKYFNIDQWLMINKAKKTYVESFGFATHSGNDSIVEYYLNHQDILEQFGLYFKEKAKELITCSEKSMLYTENTEFLEKEHSENRNVDQTKNLLNDFLIKKQYLVENYSQKTVSITKIEFIILHYLSLGLSAKQIGNRMDISFRTVETHMSQIKFKLVAKNKADLIKKYLSLFKTKIPSTETVEGIFNKSL